jgi:predicted ester cyclase
LKTNHVAFPDGHYELEDIIANGDLVAVRNVFTGTLQAPYAGVEPQGQPVAVRAVHIHRIACGQIVETWNSGDALGLLRQIGAIPGSGPSPRTPEQEAATPAVASPASDCPPGSAEENATIGRRWTEEALDSHNLDLLDEIVAPDIIHHAGIFVDEVGRDSLKDDLAALLAAFPDIRFTADVIVADEDGAAVRWAGSGTHNGPLQNIEPTGKKVVFTGINVYRIACGQIVEGWSEPDSLGLLRQLGVVPEIAPVVATPVA